jgi:hypothetical protein
MVIRIEAYECEVCDRIVKGSREDADKHEGIILSPLPFGLVYVEKRGVFRSSAPVTNYGVIVSQGLIQPDHSYAHTKIGLEQLREGELKISNSDCSSVVNSEMIRQLIESEAFKLLDEGEFDKFREVYDASTDALELCRFDSRGLTNLLDVL